MEYTWSQWEVLCGWSTEKKWGVFKMSMEIGMETMQEGSSSYREGAHRESEHGNKEGRGDNCCPLHSISRDTVLVQSQRLLLGPCNSLPSSCLQSIKYTAAKVTFLIFKYMDMTPFRKREKKKKHLCYFPHCL